MQLGGIENIERALRRAMTAEMTELEKLIRFFGDCRFDVAIH